MNPRFGSIRNIKITYVILVVILLFGTGLRLRHLTDPYLDHHSWRQTLTAMIARNFYEERNLNIFAPEVDWNGLGPSVIELELQITSYLTAILYHFFGTAEWVGRIVPILFSILSTIFLFRLVRFYGDATLALFTAFAYSVLPLNVFFTRVPMPESVMLFFSIGSLFYLSRYVRSEGRKDLVLATCFTCLAYVSKPAGLHLFIPLAFIAVARYRTRVFSMKEMWIFFGVTTGAAVAYWVGMHYLADIRMFSYEVGTDKWGNMRIWTSGEFYTTLLSRLKGMIFTLPGVLMLVAGLVLSRKKPLFYVWLAAVIVYIFVIAEGNRIHSYYQVPILPVGAYFIGVTLHRIYTLRFKWLRIVPFILCYLLPYYSAKHLEPMYEIYAGSCKDAAVKLQEIDSYDSLILSVPHQRGLMPELLYYADRKGWVVYPDELTVQVAEDYKKRGAVYMVMTEPYYLAQNRSFIEDYLNTKVGFTGKDFLIVKL